MNFKVLGVMIFTAIVAFLFVYFYKVDLVISLILSQLWALVYAINSYKKGNKAKKDIKK